MPAAIIEDDTDLDEPTGTSEDDGNTPDPVDDGNTPDTPEQIAAANDARAKALKQVAGDEDEPDARGQRIPKSRFDEVNNEKKQLAAALEQANAALAAFAAAQAKPAPASRTEAEPEFDVKAARKARLNALATGDDDTALEWDEKIEAHNLKIATEAAVRVVQESQQQLTAAQEARALADVAKSMKAKYPELDEKGDAADPDAIDFVVAKRNALISAGKPAHLALQEAVEIAAKRLGLGDDEPAPTKPDPAAARLAAARERNARAANQQAPDLGGRGERAVAPNRKVEDMTDAEIKALPKKEFDRLAGNA